MKKAVLNDWNGLIFQRNMEHYYNVSSMKKLVNKT